MPGRDGTGPLGNRSVFGRGMGYCNAVNPASIAGCGLGVGLGFGMGFRGGRHNAAVVSNAAGLSQKQVLEKQKRLLETRLSSVSDQLENLKDEG